MSEKNIFTGCIKINVYDGGFGEQENIIFLFFLKRQVFSSGFELIRWLFDQYIWNKLNISFKQFELHEIT